MNVRIARIAMVFVGVMQARVGSSSTRRSFRYDEDRIEKRKLCQSHIHPPIEKNGSTNLTFWYKNLAAISWKEACPRTPSRNVRVPSRPASCKLPPDTSEHLTSFSVPLAWQRIQSRSKLLGVVFFDKSSIDRRVSFQCGYK